MLKRLNTLWIGERLGLLEQLSLTSALGMGHQITVYSYAPSLLQDVPAGVDVANGNEIMPAEELQPYIDAGAYALASDFFRYRLLAENKGYWVDADCYFLRPLDFDNEYVFGWENYRTLNTAVLLLPAQGDFVERLNAPPLSGCPPWYGVKRRFLYYLRSLQHGLPSPEERPWGTYGPEFFTYVARTFRVLKNALPVETFYPLKYVDASKLYEVSDVVDEMIAPNTRVVHLWHAALWKQRNIPPPRGSFLDRAYRKYGLL